jgi:hypothetical protein
MDQAYVELGYSFRFESRESAERAAARLSAGGTKARVSQGRFYIEGRVDRARSATIWWVEFDDVRWIVAPDVSAPDLEAEAALRAATIERQLAEVGCVEALWSVELSGGPADASEEADDAGGRTGYGPIR